MFNVKVILVSKMTRSHCAAGTVQMEISGKKTRWKVA